MADTKPKALVMLAPGINCDRETALALRLAGADAEPVHVNDVIAGVRRLDDCHILLLPGGFSFGDDVASGQVLARKLKYRLKEAITRFVADGKLILGICNGFQVMVKLGLLPSGRLDEPTTTLTFNDSGQFEDRWVHLKANPESPCVFTKGIDQPIRLPVRHGEGKFVAPPAVIDRLVSSNQVAMSYWDPGGGPPGYPANPNGSMAGIAGVCDPTGRIFGLMPHPEAFVRWTQYPSWTRQSGDAEGLAIFKNAVAFAREYLLS